MVNELIKKELVIYVTQDGKQPFVEWLESLKDKTIRFRIKERLDRVALGNFGDYKSLKDGLTELRFKFGLESTTILARLFSEVNMVKKTSYQDYLIKSLKDPEEAAGYLNAALDGGDIKVFLLALHNVIQAQGGIANVAHKTDKSRTSLYKALSLKGNPYLESIQIILDAIGLHLQVISKSHQKKARKSRKLSNKAA